MTVLVDTNVLIDLSGPSSPARRWSARTMARLLWRARAVINPIVYAELAAGFGRVEALELLLSTAEVTVREIPRPALFLAGRQFRAYRQAGGARRSILPDFLIGAHAAVEGLPLVTRDPKRFRAYFPTVTLISPDRT